MWKKFYDSSPQVAFNDVGDEMRDRVRNRSSWLTAAGCVVVVLCGMGSIGAAPPVADQAAGFREHVTPLVSRFCVECHGDADPEGGLSLTKVSSAMETPVQIAVWKQLLDRLDGLQMPPIEAEQPSADERGRAGDRLDQVGAQGAGGAVRRTQAARVVAWQQGRS